MKQLHIITPAELFSLPLKMIEIVEVAEKVASIPDQEESSPCTSRQE